MEDMERDGQRLVALEGEYTWKIRIQGYGTFDFVGTEDRAEEMRRHKANWERGHGYKYRVTDQRESDRLTQQVCELFDRHEGVPHELLRKLQTARIREGIVKL